MRKKIDWLMLVFILLPVLVLTVTARLNPVQNREQNGERELIIADDSIRTPDFEQLIPLNSQDDSFTVLFVGIDSGEFPRGGYRPGRGRSDSLIVVQLNELKGSLTLLSIPRDTLVAIEGFGEDKINHAYAYGGIDLALATVEKFTELSIDRYIVLDYKGFAKIVDCLGGVEVEVDKSFESMHFQFEPGPRRLNGEEAYAFIRFRKEALGDIARVKRQQLFIKAVFGEIGKKAKLTKLAELFFQFANNGETDLSLGEIIRLSSVYRDRLGSLELNSCLVPGSFYNYQGISYWKPDRQKLQQIIDSNFSKVGAN